MTWREDKTLLVLSFFTIFYTMILLLVIWWKPTDGTVWQLFSGALTGFIGALGLHLKGDKVPPPGSVTDIQTRQRTEVPPVPVSVSASNNNPSQNPNQNPTGGPVL